MKRLLAALFLIPLTCLVLPAAAIEYSLEWCRRELFQDVRQVYDNPEAK